MKCRNLFSGTNKKKYFNMASALMIFFLIFPQKPSFDIPLKLSLAEAIYIKYENLVSGKIRKILQYDVCFDDICSYFFPRKKVSTFHANCL